MNRRGNITTVERQAPMVGKTLQGRKERPYDEKRVSSAMDTQEKRYIGGRSICQDQCLRVCYPLLIRIEN